MSTSNSNSLFHARYTSSPEDPMSQESSRAFDIDSERSLIGIPPADPDEHDRGLIFSYDPWTGQPSQTSASEGSEVEYAVPEDSFEASTSDYSTSLPQVMTPQSNLDVPRMDDPQSRLNGSSLSSASRLDVPYTPSASRPASVGSHGVQSSSILLQAHSRSWTSDGRTPPPLSPAAEITSSDLIDPLVGINDPRNTIILNQDDIDFLQPLMAQEGHGQPHNSDDGVSALHDRGQNRRHDSPYSRKLAEKRKTKKKESRNSKFDPSALVIRPRNDPRSQIVKKERRALTENERERARLLREIGVCLRCLWNHEPVSSGQRYSKATFGQY